MTLLPIAILVGLCFVSAVTARDSKENVLRVISIALAFIGGALL